MTLRNRLRAAWRDLTHADLNGSAAATRTAPDRESSSAAEPDVTFERYVAAHAAHPGARDHNPPGAVLLHCDEPLQEWMAAALTSLGWQVTDPPLRVDGWIAGPEDAPTSRASRSITGRGATDPTRITADSHQGRVLLAYQQAHEDRPGEGMTAAEALERAGLQTGGISGSPWHRVSDAKDAGLLRYLTDPAGRRVHRPTPANKRAEVLELTPLGLVVAQRLLQEIEAAGEQTALFVWDDPPQVATHPNVALPSASQ